MYRVYWCVNRRVYLHFGAVREAYKFVGAQVADRFAESLMQILHINVVVFSTQFEKKEVIAQFDYISVHLRHTSTYPAAGYAEMTAHIVQVGHPGR